MDQTLECRAGACSDSPFRQSRKPDYPDRRTSLWRDTIHQLAKVGVICWRMPPAKYLKLWWGLRWGDVTEESPRVVADFTAMVGIAGSLCGVLGLRASSESAKRMAANMLGGDEVSVDENVQDAFGEVCNMIAGSFKSKIAGLADRCALSVPTVISGKDYALYSLANGERFEVIFSFEGNPLSVTLDLHG